MRCPLYLSACSVFDGSNSLNPVNSNTRQRVPELGLSTTLRLALFARDPARRGFSLLQLVGALAIMAILAMMLIPSVIQQLNSANATKEAANLVEFRKAWCQAILLNKAISNYPAIPDQIASQMAVPLTAIKTTPQGRSRVFLVDPALSLPRTGGPTNLPFIQSSNNGLTGPPKSARIMILSVLSGTNPPVASGVPAANVFDAIWNTAANSIPHLPAAGWPASGRDICIERINVEPLFNQLILINHDSTNSATFSIDSTNTTAVPLGGLGWNNFYFSGSVVGLCSNTIPETRYVLSRSISYVFENGAWRGDISSGQNDPNAAAFSATATRFFNATPNPAAGLASGKGSSQIGVLACMYSYMFDYTLWATETPSFSDHKVGGAIDAVPEYAMVMGSGALLTTLNDSSDGTKGILQK